MTMSEVQKTFVDPHTGLLVYPCTECGQPCAPRRKTCGYDCMIKRDKRLQSLARPLRGTLKELTCHWCGEKFLSARSNRKYCPTKCVEEVLAYQNKEKNKCTAAMRKLGLKAPQLRAALIKDIDIPRRCPNTSDPLWSELWSRSESHFPWDPRYEDHWMFNLVMWADPQGLVELVDGIWVRKKEKSQP